MNCDVEGCQQEATKTFGKNDSNHLCSTHMNAWGYFFRGFRCALDKEDSGRCLNRKLWDKAMSGFLEWCRIEIVACTMIAVSFISGGNQEATSLPALAPE